MWLAYLLGKDAFIATNIVLNPRISGLRVSGLASQGRKSRVLILDYSLFLFAS